MSSLFQPKSTQKSGNARMSEQHYTPGHYVFFSVLDERALDLGRALPKNMCFFLPSARIELFRKKHLTSGDKKNILKFIV